MTPDLPEYEFALSYGPWKVLGIDTALYGTSPGLRVGDVFPYARRMPFTQDRFIVSEDLDHATEHYGVTRIEKVRPLDGR